MLIIFPEKLYHRMFLIMTIKVVRKDTADASKLQSRDSDGIHCSHCPFLRHCYNRTFCFYKLLLFPVSCIYYTLFFSFLSCFNFFSSNIFLLKSVPSFVIFPCRPTVCRTPCRPSSDLWVVFALHVGFYSDVKVFLWLKNFFLFLIYGLMEYFISDTI